MKKTLSLILALVMIFSLVNYAIIFFKIQKQVKNKEKNKRVQAGITEDQ
mgnify:CR=1 FL=1